ncbi:MAG TPA: phosphoribosyl-ATP diphosphatase [Gemmatimonadaceae bacterium]|nr:phosphoribosyl-ATP diphosphatase [Gemmatimonadaceae bacterium]
MIVPSVDVSGGTTVQLVGGREQVLDAGDPRAWVDAFSIAGEIAVVDIDAARGVGSNRALIAELCSRASCRVGGGIRDIETARWWLDAGAAKIVIGTAAHPGLLAQLPPDRVVVALDADRGEVVVEGWQRGTGATIEDRLRELRGLASGFLVTFVEREGRLAGTDLERAARLTTIAHGARVTIAGGVTTADEIAKLDRLGADAQVGMALYTGRLTLADAIAAPLISDRADGLFPTVVTDERGIALGLAWSSRRSIAQGVESRRGVYESRSRGLWVKGDSSGAVQDLLRIDLDCDRDALRFVVRQHGAGFCHRGTETCWGTGSALGTLERTLRARAAEPVPGSYSSRLLGDANLLAAKLTEEAKELGETDADVVHEAADLLYFAMARMARAGVSLADVERELARRSQKVTRRPGDAKPAARAGS